MEPKVGAKFYDKAGKLIIELGAHVLAEHPALAIKIGELAAEWAQAEVELSSALASLMRTTPERTFALLEAYFNASNTAKAARGLAKATLKGQELTNFESIVARFKDLANERNKVEHGLWAKKPGFPDSLFRVQALEYTRFTIKIHHVENKIVLAEDFSSSLGDEYTIERFAKINKKIRNLTSDIVLAKINWVRFMAISGDFGEVSYEGPVAP